MFYVLAALLMLVAIAVLPFPLTVLPFLGCLYMIARRNATRNEA